MSRGSRRLVDYDQAAVRYDQGRALAASVLDDWWSAIESRLSPAVEAPVVADIGAGTGIFAEEWIRRGAAGVVAIEPADAMRAKARQRADARRQFDIVAASAERLPLSSTSIDVAWMSTVVHHLTDVMAAAVEVMRVLRPDGRLFVRGYFPDRSSIPWLDFFPGAGRARHRFPTATATSLLFEGAGLTLLDVTEVVDTEPHRYAEVAEWVELMRDADSLLTALTDDEVAAGLAILRSQPDERLEPGSLTLLSFGRGA